jgi:hypothetical protein
MLYPTAIEFVQQIAFMHALIGRCRHQDFVARQPSGYSLRQRKARQIAGAVHNADDLHALLH